MKKLLALAICLVMVLTTAACGGKTTSSDYRTLYSSELTTLNYLVTGSENEFAIAANCVDTLIEYDKYGVVKPCLAKTWETSEDGLTWTFHLRDDIKWMDSTGKEYAKMTAQDFVDAAQYVLTSEHESQTANVLYGVLVNGEAYYNKEETDFSKVGIKAADDTTLVYTLNAPTPYFLSMLTWVCFMPANGAFLAECGDSFGTDNTKILYNGAYIMSTFAPQSSHVLTKNESYWDKENVFIKTLSETYNKEAATLSPEMFKRGEIDYATISSDLLDDWLKNTDTKDTVSPSRNGYYTYFYAFNFNPLFDAEYEPENWTLAVNNENFRQAIFHGLDRIKAIMTEEPKNPEKLLLNTITPPNFVDLQGRDYTQLGTLKTITERDSFDAAAAASFRDKAKEELTAAGATFPVKVLMPYNPATSNWDKECQVVEQQLEGLLGADFIDIVVEAGPSSGFLTDVRRAGKYALMKCNWGPDYADPQTYTDPFSEDSNYNWPQLCQGYENPDGTKIYTSLVDQAKAEVMDIQKRYEAFATAESYLIDHAFVVPYQVSNSGGYKVSRLNELEAQYSPFGVSLLRYKGQHLLDKPMSMDQFYENYDKWVKEREAALAAAK